MYSNRTSTDLHSRHGRRPDMPQNVHQMEAQYQPKQDLFVVLQNSPNHMPFYPAGKKGMAGSQSAYQRGAIGPRDDPLAYRIRTLVREEMNGDNEEEEEPSMADIGFPGLNNVLDKSMFIIGRIIWVVIVILCIFFCVWQVADRVMLFFSYPVSANVRIVANSTVNFPSFTLCGEDTEAIVALKKEFIKENQNREATKEDICNVTLPELVGFKANDVYEIWKLSSVNKEFKEIVFTLNPGNKELVTRAEEPMLYGICTTFTVAGDVSFYGTTTQLQIIRDTVKDGCGKTAYIMTAQGDGLYADVKGSWTVANGANLGLNIQVKEFRAINTRTNPCVSPVENSDCLRECISNRILAAVSCRLPFMGRSALPRCVTGPEAVEAYNIAESIMLATDASEDCKCTRKCIDTIYTITRESFMFDAAQTKMLIYYSDNHFEVVSEDLAYVLIALLCDIGGNLGLYLGLSVLSVFEITQSIFEVRKKKALMKLAKQKHMK